MLAPGVITDPMFPESQVDKLTIAGQWRADPEDAAAVKVSESRSPSTMSGAVALFSRQSAKP
jgi:hypothetical protein